MLCYARLEDKGIDTAPFYESNYYLNALYCAQSIHHKFRKYYTYHI